MPRPTPNSVALPHHLRIPSRTRMRSEPLIGENVLLSPVDPADGPALWEAVESSRPHLEAWLPWVPFNNTPVASQRYADNCAADWDSGRAVRLAIRNRKTARLLGIVGLDNCVHIHKSCELGYWLRVEATRSGIMTEAARLALDFGFDHIEMHRVRCAAAVDNAPSLAVIRRLGFHFEGIARNAEFVNHRWLDHAVFSLLATDQRVWRD